MKDKNNIGRKEIVRELCQRIYGNVEYEEQRLCGQVFDTLQEIIFDAVADGKNVYLRGLLNIDVIERGVRRGRNPKTGEVVEFPPSKCVKITPSKGLKEVVK